MGARGRGGGAEGPRGGGTRAKRGKFRAARHYCSSADRILRTDGEGTQSIIHHLLGVTIVIPKPDHRLRKIVFVPARAQARRAQQKMPARVSWISPQPPVGENANEVSAGKEQYISRNREHTLNYTVCPLADLCWRFASRGAVAEQLPVWTFCKNLGRTQPLILTVVPFHKVRIGFGRSSKPSQFASSGRTPQRAGKYLGKWHALKTFSKPPCVTLAI